MKISVVMPSFNQARFLGEAVRSVLDHKLADGVELVVLDACSTDGSAAYLRSINDPRLTWTSEADRGQSDAVNKGMRRVAGDVVTWLNSDDLYVAGALEKVARAFCARPEARWVVGRVIVVDEDGREFRRGVTRYKNRRLDRYTLRSLLVQNFISQMGVFWRRDFGEEVAYPNGDLLDPSLHYCMDYDLWLRFALRSEPVILDDTVACFRFYRGSKSGAVKREQFDEQYRVASRYTTDPLIRLRHRASVEKIVAAYRLMRLLGR